MIFSSVLRSSLLSKDTGYIRASYCGMTEKFLGILIAEKDHRKSVLRSSAPQQLGDQSFYQGLGN